MVTFKIKNLAAIDCAKDPAKIVLAEYYQDFSLLTCNFPVFLLLVWVIL